MPFLVRANHPRIFFCFFSSLRGTKKRSALEALPFLPSGHLQRLRPEVFDIDKEPPVLRHALPEKLPQK